MITVTLMNLGSLDPEIVLLTTEILCFPLAGTSPHRRGKVGIIIPIYQKVKAKDVKWSPHRHHLTS